VDPPSLKAGFNLFKPSSVVYFLIPSSYVTMTSTNFPVLSLTEVLTGTISLLKSPDCWAL
jgi:hypothetical protein